MTERLAELIREHQPCVALTGAGFSTETHGAETGRSRLGVAFRLAPIVSAV
jgi:NAD-dependent SIR2 family protein deacetylase